MSDDKKSNLNRRDFLTGGVGAIVGAGLMGITDKAEKSKNNNSNARTPAQADPRNIANNFSTLQKHYPILIIGSGYGGSVLAARLSSTGKQVCIFERGKEWHPGMFPKSGENLTNSQRAPLTPKGLIDNNAHIKSDVDIICASGLGGTSLLNAAIATRPEDLVFQQGPWPKEIREAHQAGILQKYMDKAQGVLGSTHHPDAMKMKKTQTLQKIAAQFGHKTQELLLNINHSKDKSIQNEYGVPQSACTMCGDCCSGCNVGAKNVLTVNYLPMAKMNGAEIYTLMEVTHIEKDASNRYTVNYVYYGQLIPQYGKVTTDLLIMAAGSMGSTQIMLKSQMKGLRLSKALGSRFSANGDVMGLSYNGNSKTNIAGQGLHTRTDAPSGQAIMAYADYRAAFEKGTKVDLMERFLLLDGTIPSAINPLVAKVFATYAKLNPHLFTQEQLKRIHSDFNNFDPKNDGAIGNSMLFFACGHDSSGGTYKLDSFEDKVHVKWPNVVDEKGFQTINRELAKYAKAQGGIYIPNPRMTTFGHRMMATHPLGGCPMGEDAQTGVVDHLGRVFSEDGSIHKSFFIVDASIIPHSLGATPLITISALAERIADFINGHQSIAL